MNLFKPRTIKAREKALALLHTCLAPVKDGLGNVPVAMQQDPRVNGAIIGLTERVCAHMGITKPALVQRVISVVFEEIYRREANLVLAQCDRDLQTSDSELCQARIAIADQPPDTPDPAWLADLENHIQNNYDRPDTLVL